MAGSSAKATNEALLKLSLSLSENASNLRELAKNSYSSVSGSSTTTSGLSENAGTSSVTESIFLLLQFIYSIALLARA